MKKIIILAAIFALIFVSCEQPVTVDNTPKLPALTIKNQSSHILSGITFSGITFATSGEDLPVSAQVKKEIPADTATSGFLTFTIKDRGINCRTIEFIDIPDEGFTFTFNDDRVVEQVGNSANRAALGIIDFVSGLSLEYEEKNVPKNDMVDLGESNINTAVQKEFTIKSSGEGNLALTGTGSVSVSGDTDVFSVVQPAGTEITADKPLTFKINFTPKEEKTYNAAVTIKSNAQEGDFTFNISAAGKSPKPSAVIIFEDQEIAQNGTINAGSVMITQTKDITIFIKNTGKAVLEIDTENISITGSDAAAFIKMTSPGANISEGNQTSLLVQYKPVKQGANQAILTIPANDSGRNPVIVYLEGTATTGTAVLELSREDGTVIPNKNIVPEDFGVVETGGKNTSLTFTIKNTGNIPLELTGNPVVESSSSVFTISSQPSKTTVNPDESVPFIVRYTPISEGEDTGTISIMNNGSTMDFSFSVKGTGYQKKPLTVITYDNTVIPQDGIIHAGDVLITMSKTITVTVKNSGDAPLTIDTSNITITGADALAFTRTTTPQTTIQTGNTTSFNIECKPVKQGENTVVLSIKTNDPARDPVIVQLKVTGIQGSGILELRQDETLIQNNNLTPVDFGTVNLGDTKSLTFDIKNSGNIALELTGTPLIESLNSVFTIPTQPSKKTLNPGESVPFIVRYTPTTEKEDTGTISIMNDGGTMDFSFTVKGNGYQKKPLTVITYNDTVIPQDGTIHAGDVLITLSKTITVTVENSGDAPLTIDTSNITIIGTDAAAFTRTTSPGMNIPAGEQTAFDIQCTPAKQGENTATLSIKTNDPARNPVFVQLKVTGVQGSGILELSQGETVIPNKNLTPVDFGTVDLSESPKSIAFTIKNTGNIALELTDSPLAVTSSNSVFTITQPAIKTLNPGASVPFIVRYMPAAETEDSGTISIMNNGSSMDFSFTVKGNGYQKKPHADIYFNDTVVPQNGTISAGEVLVTLSKTITVTVKNSGDAPLTIDPSNITIAGTDDTAFTRTTSPGVNIPAGDQTSFDIKCAPVKQGENTATLSINTNDPSRDPIDIHLKVTGVQGSAVMEVSRNDTAINNNTVTPVDFGIVNLGEPKSFTFNIKNTGNIALILSGTPVVESTNSVFSVVTQPANTTIQPGANVPFVIRYNPTAEVKDDGKISVLSNNSDGEFVFSVTGTGYEKKPQITVSQGNTAIPSHGNNAFGDIVIGEQKDITFTVGNSGDANLTFDSIDSKTINISDNTSGFFTVTADVLAGTSVVPENTTSFTVRFKPTAAGTDFTAAITIKTNSRANNEFVFTVNGKGILAAPTGVAANIQSQNSILLSWNPVQGAKNYKIYYGTSASSIETLLSDTVTETSYTHTELSAGTTYYYNVVARDGTNESVRSNTVSQLTYPGISGNLRSTASTYNSITLAWDAVTGATGYTVYYAASAEGSKTVVRQAGYGTSYTHSDLQANTTYYYFVTVVNTAGEGAYTEAISAKTLLAPLSTPNNVTATALSTNSIEVTWDAVTGATGYKVYRAIAATGTKTLLDTVTTTSYTSGGLEARTYWYFITAMNADNVDSPYSAYASMRPIPTVPSTVSARGNSGSLAMFIDWNTVSGAESYRIYFSTSPTGSKTLAGTTTSNYSSYIHTGLPANTTYYYWVTAYNIGGESDYSLQTSGVTPPAAPTLRITGNTTSTINIAWNAVPGAAYYYISGDVIPIQTTDITLDISGLSSKQSVTVWVTAYNSAGVAGPLAEIFASTK